MIEGEVEEVKEEVVKKVKLCEHPKYSKYFNMLKKSEHLRGVKQCNNIYRYQSSQNH